MSDLYPGYDVLAKRNSPSWNEQTRRVIDQRLSVPREPRFFTHAEFTTLEAICACIVPQPDTRPPIPVAALVDTKLLEKRTDGYRDYRLLPQDAAWRVGLAALNAEARLRHHVDFPWILDEQQNAILTAAQNGELRDEAWGQMDPAVFFAKRLVFDIVTAYYSHPIAWNEIGFGGPASPRGYMRMGFDRRDPWEAVEARPGRETAAARANARIR